VAVRREPWWPQPFSVVTWRRVLYVLIALPASVAALVLAVFGRAAAAARLQRGLVGRLLDVPILERPRARTLGHALLSLPLNAVALVVTGYPLVGIVLNVGYPLRGGASEADWGGPSLGGRWAVHAAGGLLFLVLLPWLVRGATRLQARLARRLL
jgi:hypothetical protein